MTYYSGIYFNGKGVLCQSTISGLSWKSIIGSKKSGSHASFQLILCAVEARKLNQWIPHQVFSLFSFLCYFFFQIKQWKTHFLTPFLCRNFLSPLFSTLPNKELMPIIFASLFIKKLLLLGSTLDMHGYYTI